MAWFLTLHTKIFCCLHQPRAKELLPNSVYRHARSKRVLFVHQPYRKTEAIFRCAFGESRQTLRRVARYHDIARLIVNAASQHLGLARFAIAHHHHFRETFANGRDTLFCSSAPGLLLFSQCENFFLQIGNLLFLHGRAHGNIWRCRRVTASTIHRRIVEK